MYRITKECMDNMVKLRKQGKTYKEIEQTLHVSRWATLKYLKGIKVEKGVVEAEWKKAEDEAKAFIESRGFTDYHNLNSFCPTPYWDILAKYKGKWWLIDVTISDGKRVGAKIPYFTEGYTHAILYRNIHTQEWRMVKLTYEDVKEAE